jgi:hypothetical protein
MRRTLPRGCVFRSVIGELIPQGAHYFKAFETLSATSLASGPSPAGTGGAVLRRPMTSQQPQPRNGSCRPPGSIRSGPAVWTLPCALECLATCTVRRPQRAACEWSRGAVRARSSSHIERRVANGHSARTRSTPLRLPQRATLLLLGRDHMHRSRRVSDRAGSRHALGRVSGSP